MSVSIIEYWQADRIIPVGLLDDYLLTAQERIPFADIFLSEADRFYG